MPPGDRCNPVGSPTGKHARQSCAVQRNPETCGSRCVQSGPAEGAESGQPEEEAIETVPVVQLGAQVELPAGQTGLVHSVLDPNRRQQQQAEQEEQEGGWAVERAREVRFPVEAGAPTVGASPQSLPFHAALVEEQGGQLEEAEVEVPHRHPLRHRPAAEAQP